MPATDIPSYELIDEVDTGGLKVAVVRAALELDVFTFVDGGATDVDALAAACGCARRGMETLVRGLVSLGLLERTVAGLRCSPTASALC